MSEPFPAEARMVGFDFAPRGWAFCEAYARHFEHPEEGEPARRAILLVFSPRAREPNTKTLLAPCLRAIWRTRSRTSGLNRVAVDST